MAGDHDTYLEEMSGILKETVKNLVTKHSETVTLEEPRVTKQTIHEYEGRMRVSALEKFNGAGYVAGTSYYLSEKDRDARKAVGTFVLYLNEASIENTCRLFGHKVEEEEFEQCVEACLKICIEISKQFQTAVASKGYADIVALDVESYRNTMPAGIDFCFKQYDKYEILFSIKEEPRIALDISLTALPKR